MSDIFEYLMSFFVENNEEKRHAFLDEKAQLNPASAYLERFFQIAQAEADIRIRRFDSSPEGAVHTCAWTRKDPEGQTKSLITWAHDLETCLRKAILLEEAFIELEKTP